MRRRSNRHGRWLSAGAWGTPRERREADLFLADLLGRSHRTRGPAEFDPQPAHELDPGPERYDEAWDEVVQACWFPGAHNIRRTEQEVRDAVVARANAEWTAWHTAAGVPVAESAASQFGRLVGYSLAANADIEPDQLMALQAAGLGPINYTPLLSATNNVAPVRAAIISASAASVTNNATTQARVTTALTNARQANKDDGAFKSWSAVFVVACVRAAAIGLGLETVTGTGSTATHHGKNTLLLATIRHSEYTREARIRAAAGRTATYHAFTPDERPPRLGDIIVQDRRPSITAQTVMTLANLPERLETHGDIVVEVQRDFVVTVGGNLTAPSSPSLGDSCRKRRYPLNAQGRLVVDRTQRFAQEDDTGALAALPLPTTAPLHTHSTKRIFAVLSPVAECRAPMTLPYPPGTRLA